MDRRLTGVLSEQHQLLREWSDAHEKVNQALLQSIGQSTSLQQTANGLLHQLLDRQRSDHETSGEQMAQLLTHQRQSVEGITHTVKLLELQHADTQELKETLHEGVAVQQEAIDTVKALVKAAAEENLLWFSDTRGSEGSPGIPKAEALPLDSRDVLRWLDAALLKERRLFSARLKELNDLQSNYFQSSIEQQHQIARSLERLEEAMARAMQRQGLRQWLQRLRVWRSV